MAKISNINFFCIHLKCNNVLSIFTNLISFPSLSDWTDVSESLETAAGEKNQKTHKEKKNLTRTSWCLWKLRCCSQLCGMHEAGVASNSHSSFFNGLWKFILTLGAGFLRFSGRSSPDQSIHASMGLQLNANPPHRETSRSRGASEKMNTETFTGAWATAAVMRRFSHATPPLGDTAVTQCSSYVPL